MYQWQKNSIMILVVAGLFYVLSFSLNNWLSLTMPRHQLIQLPAMIVLGVFLGIYFSKINIKSTSNGISILIFVMTSLIFWMLPRSVDLAAIHPGINRLMHLNMLIAGFLVVLVLRNINFKVKIVFFEMLSAMLIALGMTLHSFNRLLCSSYNIAEQKETGFYFMIIGAVLFLISLIYFFTELEKIGKTAPKGI